LDAAALRFGGTEEVLEMVEVVGRAPGIRIGHDVYSVILPIPYDIVDVALTGMDQHLEGFRMLEDLGLRPDLSVDPLQPGLCLHEYKHLLAIRIGLLSCEPVSIRSGFLCLKEAVGAQRPTYGFRSVIGID